MPNTSESGLTQCQCGPILLQMDPAVAHAWLASVRDPVDVARLTPEEAWAAPARKDIDVALLAMAMTRFFEQEEAVRRSIPPTSRFLRFSTERLGFLEKQFPLDVTYTEWLSQYGKYSFQLMKKADADLDACRRARTEWLEARMADETWSSYEDVHKAGGPTYNTIRRWASGKSSSQDRSVKSGLRKAFNCKITDIPE